MKLRPRFSLRTLCIVMSLICAYFAAWAATKAYGIPQQECGTYRIDRQQWFIPAEETDAIAFETTQANGPGIYRVEKVRTPGPLLMIQDQLVIKEPHGLQRRRRYYVWLFGPMIKLPFETAN